MAEDNKYAFLDEALAARQAKNQLRTLTSCSPEGSVLITRDGKKLINFSSNDYLGLSKHPAVIQRAKDFTEKYGAGSTASRLISGTFEIHERAEWRIAADFRKEAALLFNSGFQANSTIIGTLTNRHSLILSDKLSHNSLIQGSLLSRAKFMRFTHNDLEDLESLLVKAEPQSYSRVLIITETVFSMDGDRSNVEAIAALAEKYNALLFVDDAHAVGVWGERGLGLAYKISGIDILLGTCGKAFGTFGAYVACSKKMKNYLVNYCPGFIYTTALPPSVIGSIEAALEVIPTLETERMRYHERIKHVRSAVNEMGFNTGDSTTQIIPLIVGSEEKTLDLASWLEDRGILGTAIRPPTVPGRSSRIRLTLTSQHSDKDIEQLLSALRKWVSRG